MDAVPYCVNIINVYQFAIRNVDCFSMLRVYTIVNFLYKNDLLLKVIIEKK